MSKKTKPSALDNLKIDTKVLVAEHIKNKLNELFFLPPKYDEELEMLKYQYDHEEKIRMGLHASSIVANGNKICYRKQVVSILYKAFYDKGKKAPAQIRREFEKAASTERKINVNLARIFEEGKSIGTKWQRLFIRGDLGVKEDMDVQRLEKEYDLLYTPDGIITLDGKKYVVEIKSMNTFAFQKAKSHPSGQKQLKLYMYFEGIERGFVLVDDKNTSDFKIFMEENVNESDPDIADALYHLERIQKQKAETLKTKELPPCTCGKCI